MISPESEDLPIPAPDWQHSMKLLGVVFLICAGLAEASLLGLVTVKQPLYLPNSDGGAEILIRDVQVATSQADPEGLFSAISLPFIPPTDGTWKKPTNLNLVSLVGIKVVPRDLGKVGIEVLIDASSARVQSDTPFTIDEIITATERCVREVATGKSYSAERIVIKVLRPTTTDGEPANGKPTKAPQAPK